LLQASFGALPFSFFLAKRANLAETALLAIDPLEKEDQQKIAPQGAECQENGKWRHDVSLPPRKD
jgi:hypothetical protein